MKNYTHDHLYNHKNMHFINYQCIVNLIVTFQVISFLYSGMKLLLYSLISLFESLIIQQHQKQRQYSCQSQNTIIIYPPYISIKHHSLFLRIHSKVKNIVKIVPILPFLMKAIFQIAHINQTHNKKMRSDISQGNHSASVLKQLEYVRTMGSFKPKFQGIPQEYFPLQCWQVVKYSIFVLAIIGAGLGIMVGFLFWVTNNGLTNYTIAWCVIFLVFVAVMIFLFFHWGKSRIREEKRMINEQQKKEEKLKNKVNVRKMSREEDR